MVEFIKVVLVSILVIAMIVGMIVTVFVLKFFFLALGIIVLGTVGAVVMVGDDENGRN